MAFQLDSNIPFRRRSISDYMMENRKAQGEEEDRALRQRMAESQMQREQRLSERMSGPQSGGATGVLIEKYMEATGATFPEALQAVQSGMRQNMLYQNGAMTPIPGAANALGELAKGKEIGKQTGTAIQTAQESLPQVTDNANFLTTKVDELVNDPAFKSAVGWQSYFPTARGSKVSDFENKLEQVGGAAFLQAFESLKGGGQITEVEGAKATAAINRMKTSTSEEGFKAAADDFKEIIKNAVGRTAKAAQGDFTPNKFNLNTTIQGNKPSAGQPKFLGFE